MCVEEKKMNQEVLIVCESMYHGNTKKLATAMGIKLNCRVLTCDEASKENIDKYKIIGLGSGIYFTSHHPKLIEFAKKIKSTQKVFIFSTHGRPYLGKYHDTLKLFLSTQGVLVIGEFSCRGYDCTGPYIIIGGGNKGKPNEKDANKAANFVSALLPQYSKNTDVAQNGNNIEIHHESCIGCGRCQAICPMKVFEMQDKKPIIKNELNCIHCSLCKENCPSQAISIQHTWKEAIAIAKRHVNRTSL